MTKRTPNKRLSRYIPSTNAFPDLTLKHRDHNILRLVYTHRFLNLELLRYLLRPESSSHAEAYTLGADGKKRPAKYGFGQQALSKRLRQLFHARYLERHYLTDHPIGRGHGAPRAIYGLGPQSAKVLEEAADVPAREVRRIVEGNRITSPFLRHDLEIARFRVTLELACRLSHGAVELLFWEQGDAIRDYVKFVNDQGEDDWFPVHADSFFGLEIQGTRRKHFFLEIDRGTEPIASNKQRTDIRRKLIAYRMYRESARFRSRYAYLRFPDGAVTGLTIRSDYKVSANGTSDSIAGFQVLFVVSGIRVTQRGIPERIENMLSLLNEIGTEYASTTLFLFASSKIVQVDDPQSLLRAGWLTANPHKSRMSLIE